ncbi:MAG: prepilin-type N-terminal cleavage/methylation domain-containing protein [Candidatus Aminicenantes bacterium]|nr:MAG: prepilin-type N-terminal cleavage/methylation domain-containing protein [Candidatus Aminicenantes bacterium]
MKEKKSKQNTKTSSKSLRPGFTLVELLVGSMILLVVVLATLSLYRTSNQIAVDQQQFAELQHGVRSGMYFISRDARMAGVNLPIEFYGYALEGVDNENQGAVVEPDRLKVLGNFDEPLNLRISNYQGAAANLSLEDYSLEQFQYEDAEYEEQTVLIIPNPESGCMVAEVRTITHVTHDATGQNERLNFSPGLAPGVNPPGGLSGTCPSSNDYDGGMVTFVNVKEYWLDVTGNYPGLTAGTDGYIGNGEGNILYLTMNGIHYPLARNVENLQFEYNGDFDNDANNTLDGFIEWQSVWTGDITMVRRIRQVKIWVLGRTENPFVSIGANPPANIHLYRRPTIANSPGASDDDKHKRFLLESTSNIRNLSLNIYNTGTR